MLDNLRGMAVFASVVDSGSFGGAAKALGITTSAVSQQVRALESEIGIILLHRSTRKISLTEAGESFYQSCQDVVNAARNGRIRLSALRDEITGQIRIATTPELAHTHLLPAMLDWLNTHQELALHVEADNKPIDLIEERIDLALQVCKSVDEARYTVYPLKTVRPVLVATPDFLATQPNILVPNDLLGLNFIHITNQEHTNAYEFNHAKTGECQQVNASSRMETNNVFVAKSLALQSKGVLCALDIDVQPEIDTGKLVALLPQWQQPAMQLNVLVLNREQHPAKVVRCIDLIQKYFAGLDNLPKLKTAS